MRYTVILEREADGGYVATVPALPGCVSQGDTRDEVMRNIREAADLYIEDCIAAGDPVPSEAGREYFELKTGALLLDAKEGAISFSNGATRTPALSSRITGGFAPEPCGRF
jgi:predicted RNase H-like HicB family nuclease